MTGEGEIRWVTPLGKPWNKIFVNEAERGFAQFADVCDIKWEYEPHFWIKFNSSLPKGHNDKGYCPDFYLEEYDCYVEIHGAEEPDRSHRQLTPKRNKIRWLSSHTGKPVVLLHYNCWPVNKVDFERLLRRAEIAATFEFADPLRIKYCP